MLSGSGRGLVAAAGNDGRLVPQKGVGCHVTCPPEYRTFWPNPPWLGLFAERAAVVKLPSLLSGSAGPAELLIGGVSAGLTASGPFPPGLMSATKGSLLV